MEREQEHGEVLAAWESGVRFGEEVIVHRPLLPNRLEDVDIHKKMRYTQLQLSICSNSNFCSVLTD